MNYDWKYELELKIEDKIEYNFGDEKGFDLLSLEIGLNIDWQEIEKIESAKDVINMKLEWLYKSIKSVDDSARISTIEWYRDNEDVEKLSDEEIEDLDGFWGNVESDLQVYWDDINDEYEEIIEIFGEQRDESALTSAISDAQDELHDIIEKLKTEYIPESQREVMIEIWDY